MEEDQECIHGLGLKSACTICNCKDKQQKERDKIKIFLAKYQGVCYLCDDMIHVGDYIAWSPGTPVVHEECIDWQNL